MTSSAIYPKRFIVVNYSMTKKELLGLGLVITLGAILAALGFNGVLG
jgi:hypothetical protein